MKRCITCQEEKDLADFYKHPESRDGHLGKCKECQKASSRKSWFKRNYGLTEEVARAMYEEGCAICGATRNLHIDHDHETNQVRGCLCFSCNTGVGLFRDNPDLLLRAAEYLRRS